MKINIREIRQEDCNQIVSWHYPEDYQWTTLGKGSENEIYLLSEKYREDHYYAICDQDELIGYFSLNDKIRKEYGALQLVIRPDLCVENKEIEILKVLEKKVLESYGDCHFLNAVCYDYQKHAIAVYEHCGYKNNGLVSAQGHDMQVYEQEGFDAEGSGLKKQIGLYILSKKIR